MIDSFYYVYSIYYGYEKAKPNLPLLARAEGVLDELIIKYPTAQDAFLFKAKINNLLDKDDLMVKSYQDYINVVTAKGPDEVTKAKTKFIEAYNNIGAFYANTDKAKATEMWNKTLALDPTKKELLWQDKLTLENGIIGSIKVNQNRIYLHTQDQTLFIYEKE